jgi:hypothetical protein
MDGRAWTNSVAGGETTLNWFEILLNSSINFPLRSDEKLS